MSLLTDEVRSWIGKEAVFESPDELGRAAIRYFAIAVGDENPLWTDASHAREHGHDDVIAPPTLICETNQFISGPREADGYLMQMFDLGVPGTKRIRGGNEYEFMRPVRPSDRVTITWRLTDITERTTSGGTPMLVVTSEATYTNQDGETLARNTETIIYLAS